MNIKKLVLVASGALGAGLLACSSTDSSGPSGPVAVTSVAPDHGTARGGDTITIVGSGFGSAPTVHFGTGQATVQSATDTQIVALAPKGTAGPVDVEVDVGSSSGKLNQSFTYEALPMSFLDSSWTSLASYLVAGAGAASADVNGDGAIDVLQAAGTEGVLVWTNDKKGNLGAPKLVTLPTIPAADATSKPTPTDARSLAAGDFDGDGKIDLYVGTGSGTPNVLLLGDGKGGFIPSKVALPALVGTNETVVAADLDGDKDLDLVLVGVGVTAKDPPQVAILSNDKGKLTDVTKQLAGGSFAATGVAVGDVDKDGDLDLFFGVDTQSSRLYVNDGKATFQHASPDALPTDALNAGVPAMGDLDGNGTVDIYVPSSGQDHYLSNDGTGIFTDLSTLRLGQENSNGASASLVDFDMDGRLDVLVIDRTGNTRLYRNDTSNRLFDYTDQIVGAMSDVSDAALTVGDFDADGDLDIFVSRADLAPPTVLLNAAPIAATDGDGDGIPDQTDDCPTIPDPEQTNFDSLSMHCYSGMCCKATTGCTLYAHG
ncbi:MAG TPA: FG-GAP-like repeat-containing protein, partial [Polyangiaceae bacterium]